MLLILLLLPTPLLLLDRLDDRTQLRGREREGARGEECRREPRRATVALPPPLFSDTIISSFTAMICDDDDDDEASRYLHFLFPHFNDRRSLEV